MNATPAILEAIAKMEREGRVIEHRPAQVRALPLVDVIDEKDFMAAVIAFAKRQGWLCYHTFNSRKSEAGFPDLVLIRADVLLVVELKVGINRPTAPQQSWLEAFRAAGVRTFLWYPKDWPTIVSLLE
jgi:hypothetical protein